MRKLLSLMLASIMLLTMLAACGGDSTPTTAPTTAATATTAETAATTAPTTEAAATPSVEATAEVPAGGLAEVDPATVQGDIVTAGSSTVYPLSEAVAEIFGEDGYKGNITIDSIGTGAGFERFCTAAETDIANASRAIKDEEAKACADKGRDVIEFRVGTDALAVVVSSKNTFVSNLTEAQVANIFSGTYKTWNQVDASYPNEAIKLYSPGTDSGTFDYFVEHFYDKEQKYILGANPQLSEDDNVLVTGIEGDANAIGYFGYAYYNENKTKLKALTIDSVEPTEATTEDGSYSLARPLYIYSAKNILAEKPQVAAFINYYLTNVNDVIVEVGYFPASAEALNEAKQHLVDALIGGSSSTGGNTNAGSAVTLEEVDPAAIQGDIVTAGSSTVYPLSEAVAEIFGEDGYKGNITIDSIGTGAGFERFCTAAETDIANASRAIKDEEAKACADKGRDVIEFRVGTDALAVVVSSKNTFVSNLTEAQVADIFSGTYKTWDQVDASYPAEAIKLYSPGTDSGTFDYFVEHFYDKEQKYILGANPQLSEDDNVLVTGIEGDANAIGYFGYAYYNENKTKLKALTIDSVEPTEATTEDGSYSLARPLYIYSAKNILAEKPQVAAFINYYLTNVNDVIVEVGYFPASAEALNEAKQHLLDATK
ncbi:PstS family phosphate ABC transporter substrate-binding protein [Herpetosiphon giganteus]|uniref:PstS family phosphate ABC transporter substrate-binding protein n=1 Tax=Herpetosiphon giganteus TaxID=2029754 RepID=UPI00195ECD09|nr:PstS family phosphate ABC transporter substrate-binding protein [Herpetosiphon giganteus]MBM7846575.1 phosphate binding protein [Herpetosiphon giganteus]